MKLLHNALRGFIRVSAALLFLATTQAATFTPLGDLPGGIFNSGAVGVSDDGSVVVGGSFSASGGEAFRWTSGGGMVGLGDLAGGDFDSVAAGVSNDGSVVVGRGTSALGGEAFRWTSGGGMAGLGDLAGGSFFSGAFDVSANGSVVVGVSERASGFEAFRWTSGTGMVGLGDLAGGIFESIAFGVSADGSVVVGIGNSASGVEAFRWTSGTGMVGLGDLAGGDFFSIAFGVSADGSVVVGFGNNASGEDEAFVWTQANGMENLLDVLVANGATGLNGWTLTGASAISADGRTIVGEGTNPLGGNEGWIATLDISPIDSDGDGVPDDEDAFPNDPSEWLDTDSDGIGNNADPDDDNDGIPDNEDEFPLGRFNDVSPNHWAVTFIERLAESGITAGCGNDNYCPASPVTRAQMAVFLERGMRGSGYGPPAPTGNVFDDVAANYWAASFIEQFFLDGITAGCGNNNYCPDAEVTRDQMAIFLLRAKYGAGYSPPAASGIFNDVPLNHWAVHWIEQLAAEGITAGCGNNNYCPDAPVNRDQMAVFLVRTFGL